ncbi:Rieske (2Fe-2S) protein [Chloroflexales bacterium ZM16-3]|nr:Rieske (2Fe-2S) protein [Chloroflexales bacterium ZM16-3]
MAKNTPQPKKDAPAGTTVSRRDFLALGAGALGLVGLLQTGGMALQFLAPRRVDGEFGGVVSAGPAESFPPGSVTEFPDGRFFLARAADGGFLAVSRRCTHLGCAVSWHAADEQFACPCHGSHFDLIGDVQNPPAPRALDTYPITVRDGALLVDTAQAQQRDSFAPEQLVYV